MQAKWSLARWGFLAAYAWILQEILTRLVFPVPEVLNFDRLHYSPRLEERVASLGHASFRWSSEPDAAESVHRLNLYGFRDATWRVEPRGGRLRVAFVGDSMVEGFMADASRTIPASFGRRLAGEGNRVEVMNLGIGAAGLPEYFQLLRDAVPLFRPSHVILVLYVNDFRSKPPDPRWLAGSEVPEFSRPWQPRLVHVLREWRRRGRVPKRWWSRPLPFLPPPPDPGNPWSDPEKAARQARIVPPRIADAIRRGTFNPSVVGLLNRLQRNLSRRYELRPHLAALQAFLGTHSSRLWVVYLPSLVQVSDGYLASQRELSPSRETSFLGKRFRAQADSLSEACLDLGIPFLDLTPVLRGHEAAGRKLYWEYDAHMRGEGYQLAGETIAAWWSAAGTPDPTR